MFPTFALALPFGAVTGFVKLLTLLKWLGELCAEALWRRGVRLHALTGMVREDGGGAVYQIGLYLVQLPKGSYVGVGRSRAANRGWYYATGKNTSTGLALTYSYAANFRRGRSFYEVDDPQHAMEGRYSGRNSYHETTGRVRFASRPPTAFDFLCLALMLPIALVGARIMAACQRCTRSLNRLLRGRN